MLLSSGWEPPSRSEDPTDPTRWGRLTQHSSWVPITLLFSAGALRRFTLSMPKHPWSCLHLPSCSLAGTSVGHTPAQWKGLISATQHPAMPWALTAVPPHPTVPLPPFTSCQ